MERLFIFKFTESKEQKTKIKALPILVVRLWRSFFYKIKMIKHFFKRLLIVIITLVVVFFVCNMVIKQNEGTSDAMGTGMMKAYRMIFSMFFSVVVAVFGLIFDSVFLYRKQEKEKAKTSLFVLIILLLTIFLAITITITFS